MADDTPTKVCTRCNEPKPVTHYVMVKTRNKGLPRRCAWCKDCTRARCLNDMKPFRDFTDKIKLESGCVDCGYNAHPRALEFDHLPGTEKVANISELVRRRTPLDILAAEIAKCEVVCANCHAERTHQRKQARKGAQADAVH